MYTIKQIPEDFVVKEIPIFELSEGEFLYFWLKKKEYNTMSAIKKLSEKLNIPLKYIGFAGTKDRNAVTEQVISIRYSNKEKIENLDIKDINLGYIGKGKKPISLGDLEGNQFKIAVRNLDSNKFKLKSAKKIPNYFGPQRFSKNNIEVGRYILQKKFQKSLDLIDDPEVKDYIESSPGDFVGALRVIPLKLRKIYIHSLQSYIWNNTVKEYLKTNPLNNEKIPVVGFSTIIENTRLREIVNKLLEKEGFTQRDFITRQIPELSSEGTERDMFIEIKDLKVDIENDELNEGKYKAILEFSLPKGSYATVVIDYLFNPEV